MKELYHDIKRYSVLIDKENIFIIIFQLISNPSIWFLTSYRIGRYVRYDFHVPIIKKIFKFITYIIHFFICLLTGIDIPFQTKIGKGLHISHFGCIVISPRAEIGEFCNIGPGLVIGEAGRERPKGVPKIGNRIYIGVGAKIIGGVRIGDNVAIGANAVVISDIPDNATVVGVPARIVNYKGSDNFIKI